MFESGEYNLDDNLKKGYINRFMGVIKKDLNRLEMHNIRKLDFSQFHGHPDKL